LKQRKKDDVVEKTLALVVIENYNGKVLNIYAYIFISAWITYYGTTKHKKFDFKDVSSLNFSSQKFIFIINDTLSSVVGGKSLTLTNNLKLDFVIIVPS